MRAYRAAGAQVALSPIPDLDRQAVLAAFDEQVRRRPDPDGADGRVERGDRVVRCVSGASGWLGVIWSALDETDADAVIAAQVSRFAALGRPWEWKHYSYDQPPDLPARLLAAGFAREPPKLCSSPRSPT